MAIVQVCFMIAATLSVHPDRSSFFYYETLTLSCAVPGNFSGWTVKRNTSTKSSSSSCKMWGQVHGSSCSIKGAYPSDSGVYWCESEGGECSNTINITVSTGVILESPAAPLTEGDNVTLKCSYKEKYAKDSTSNFNAAFYRDGALIGNQPEGKMMLIHLTKKDEGFYKCHHPTKGESLQSWLSVRDRAEPTSAPTPTPPLISPPSLLSMILLSMILVTAILILSVYAHRKCVQARAEAKRKEPDHL